MTKKIGIIGSGVVAQSLGKGFLNHGYPVRLGTRDSSKLASWQQREGQGAEIGSFQEAASFGDIIVLAVAGRAALEALKIAGADNLKGKTIIDATNPIDEAPPVNGVLRFFTGPNESLMEQLQLAVPEAHFVKCFSSVGYGLMVNPPFKSRPTMFICGNKENAKKEVNHILDQFGWEVADMGAVEAARAIEPLAILYCIPGFLKNEWTHAFNLLKL